MRVEWRVENLGTNRTNSEYWYDEVYLSADGIIGPGDIRLGDVHHSGALDPSGSYEVGRNFTLPRDLTGTYRVIVRTDSTNLVLEIPLEGNNERSADGPTGGGGGSGETTIGQGPTPDLVLVGVDAPTDGLSGQTFTLSWTVRNDRADTEGSWYDAIYLSRDQVFDRRRDTYLGFLNRPSQPGLRGLIHGQRHVRDPDGALRPVLRLRRGRQRQRRRRGATASRTTPVTTPTSMLVSLAPPADLAVGTITIPANAVPGQNATIAYTVHNQGANPALGNWFDSIYISADDRLGPGRRPLRPRPPHRQRGRRAPATRTR